MKSRRSKALDATEDDIEIIYDIFDGPDFVEIQGTIGGDVVCYRVYFDDNDNIDFISER